MAIISHEKFLEVFDVLPPHSELEFYFSNTSKIYVIVKYEKKISFALSGYPNEWILPFNRNPDSRCSEEVYYDGFEELYVSRSVDNICLKEEWENISDIVVNDSFRLINEIDEIFKVYKGNTRSDER